jgi:hypothetical protein
MGEGIIGLLIILNSTFLFIVGTIHFLNKIKSIRYNDKTKDKTDKITREFAIGIFSGLIVFILTFGASKLNFGEINLNSFKDLIISSLGGLVSLTFQITLIVLITSWATYSFLKIFTEKDSQSPTP